MSAEKVEPGFFKSHVCFFTYFASICLLLVTLSKVAKAF